MRNKRKSKIILLLGLVLSLCLSPVRASYHTPEISAVSAILMEQESRTVLYSCESDAPLPIASITKIMTGLLAAERCDLQAEVVIRSEWLGTEGSNMGLRAGDIRSVEELLYGLLLASGNDAAVSLACYMDGDVSAFVQRMNQRAEELGMTGTCFRNPHGLTQEGHYSTARDMGILTCAALENDRFVEIVGSRYREVDGVVLRNHNRMLWEYPGAFGVKTGYTEAAGRTLVSCAKQDGMTLVCVTLNDPEDWKDHTALLDWGFSAYDLVDPAAYCWTLPVISGETETVRLQPLAESVVPVRKNAERIWRAELPPFLYAPCEKGTEFGRTVLYADGEPVYSGPLIIRETVRVDENQRLNLWERFCRIWSALCRTGAAPPPSGFY